MNNSLDFLLGDSCCWTSWTTKPSLYIHFISSIPLESPEQYTLIDINVKKIKMSVPHNPKIHYN